MKSYPLRVVIAVDQFFNVLLLNGNEDQTISGHVGYKAQMSNAYTWRIAEKIINTLIWFDPNHCFNSIEWDEV